MAGRPHEKASFCQVFDILIHKSRKGSSPDVGNGLAVKNSANARACSPWGNTRSEHARGKTVGRQKKTGIGERALNCPLNSSRRSNIRGMSGEKLSGVID